MILVSRMYDLVDNYTTKVHVLSIVATDDGFQYVFGTYPNAAPFDSDTKVKQILDKMGDQASGLTAQDYVRVARTGLGHYFFSDAVEASSEELAISQEEMALDHQYIERQKLIAGARVSAIGRRAQDVFDDFPELEDQLSSEDPNQEITAAGMDELVLALIGDAAPDGPNAWFLDSTDTQQTDSSSADGVIVINESNFDKEGNPLTPGDD